MVVDLFIQLLRTYSDEQIRAVLDAGIIVKDGCVLYVEVRDSILIIYVCDAALLENLQIDIARRKDFVAVAYTITRDRLFRWWGQTWILKIAGYGVPCDRLGRAWLASSALR